MGTKAISLNQAKSHEQKVKPSLTPWAHLEDFMTIFDLHVSWCSKCGRDWTQICRGQLRAELDATYARLYGLTRDELRYILDPKEVHVEDFPGETFRVLKEKEIKQFGEYRTRRLVLEAWDEMGQG